MTITEIKELRKWHRQQSSIWQEGYDIWGRQVADNLVAVEIGQHPLLKTCMKRSLTKSIL